MLFPNERLSPFKRCSMVQSGQGRNEVRWRPGQRSMFGSPYSNLRSFGTKCAALKKVVVTLLGLFGAPAAIRRPHSDSVPGELFPLAPLATLLKQEH